MKAKPIFSQKGCKVLPFLLSFAFLGVVFLIAVLLGSLQKDKAAGVALLHHAEGQEILLLEAEDGDVWLACGGEKNSYLLRADGETGRVKASRELKASLHWASFQEETVYCREDAENTSWLVACDAETLQEIFRRELPWAPEDIYLFSCDEAGDAFCVLSQSRETLRVSSPGKAEQTSRFPAEIDFLECAGNGPVFHTGEELHLPDGKNVPCSLAPLACFENGYFLDGDGALCDDELTPLYQCEESLYGRLSYCLDGENCLILSKGDGSVYRYDETGEAVDVCKLETMPLAVCAAGGVTKKDGTLFYTPFEFAAAPSPAPTPEPTLGPVEPPVTVEDNFLLLEPGATADDLRELFQPEGVLIYDRLGKQMTHGRLATGMTAGEWTVVIRGDCNGSGTINERDLRAASTMLLTGEYSSEADYRAADLNDDGELDTTDLVLLSKLVW